jgi:hypothetical protein
MKSWNQNVTAAQRDLFLWSPDDATMTSEDADGRRPISADDALEIINRSSRREDGNVFDQMRDDWSFPVHPMTSWNRDACAVGEDRAQPTRARVSGVTMNLVRRSKRARRRRAPAVRSPV